MSASAGDSDEFSWTWISDLPLECVDHSVRIRIFCNQSAPSPWSEWMEHRGEKTLICVILNDLSQTDTLKFRISFISLMGKGNF